MRGDCARARVVARVLLTAALLSACSLSGFGGFSSGAITSEPADGDGGTSGTDGGSTPNNDGSINNLVADGSSASDSGAGGDGTIVTPNDYRATVMADAPLAYWRLGETSGLVAKDEVGLYNGGYQGGITLGIPGPITDSDTAISMNASGTSVQIGNVLDFEGTVPITLEAWVNLDVIDTDYKRVIAKRGTGGSYSIFCHVNSNGCAVELSGANSSFAQCDFTMQIGTWYHLVAAYDGATLRAYRDGIEVCTKTAKVTFQKIGTNLVLGAWPQGGNTFKGKLDEIAIYNTALSAARVQAHYARRKP